LKTKTKMNKIIFTTKDGYDITEGIKYYSVRVKECKTTKSPLWSMCGPYINPKAYEPTGEIEYFYKKENAVEFINQNKADE